MPSRSVVLQELVVHASIVAFDGERWFGNLSFNDEVVVAVRAVFIAVLKLLRVFAKALFALFAGKGHVVRLEKGVLLLLGMAVGTVEPLAAYMRQGKQSVLRHGGGRFEAIRQGRCGGHTAR